METIRVYHSLWKTGLLVAFSFVASVFSIAAISLGNDRITAWLCLAFFGIGGLFMLWLTLKERITNKPYYLITDDGIVMNSGIKTYEIHFADVESFFLVNLRVARGATKLIAIQYTKEVELQKFEDANMAGRAVRRFNERVAGSQESIPADGLTIKPKKLCEILNERIKLSRNLDNRTNSKEMVKVSDNNDILYKD